MTNTLLISYIALWILLLFTLACVLGLAREFGILYVRLGPPGALMSDEGLGLGTLAPSFSATAVPAGQKTVFEPVGTKPSLILFITPTCHACRRLLPALETGWKDWQNVVSMHVICEGDEPAVKALIEKSHLTIPLLADPFSRVREAYGQTPTPFAFLIDTAGTIRLKGIVNTHDDIDRLVEGQVHLQGGKAVVVKDLVATGDQVGGVARRRR